VAEPEGEPFGLGASDICYDSWMINRMRQGVSNDAPMHSLHAVARQ